MIAILMTQHETEMMELLWDNPEGMTHIEMIENARERSWRDSTAHLLINGLLAKKMIQVIGKRPSGRRHSRIFAPAISRMEYQERRIKETFGDMDGESFVHLFASFVKQNALSDSTRKELFELLQDAEGDDMDK